MSAYAGRSTRGERLKPKGLSTLTQDIDEKVPEVYGWRTLGEASLNLYCSASAMWSVAIAALPARSAIVRLTRSTRSHPRALNQNF